MCLWHIKLVSMILTIFPEVAFCKVNICGWVMDNATVQCFVEQQCKMQKCVRVWNVLCKKETRRY